MKDWQIAVLVVIIVIFILVMIIYAFLVGKRWWEGTFSTKEGLPNLLYFVDLKKQLRSIPLDTVRPPITDGPSLRRELARLCSIAEDDTIALSRVDEGNVLVELNLDELMAPSNRSSAAFASMQTPYHVSRHWVTRSQSPPPIAHDAISVAVDADMVPIPNIFPHYPNITTDTALIICAVDYTFPDSGLRVNPADVPQLDIALLAREPSMVRLRDGQEVLVEPANRSCKLQPSGASLRMTPAQVVRYCYENSPNPRWRIYSEPFRLPAGRWCVRAEAATVDHRYSRSNSRVFTVDTNKMSLR